MRTSKVGRHSPLSGLLSAEQELSGKTTAQCLIGPCCYKSPLLLSTGQLGPLTSKNIGALKTHCMRSAVLSQTSA